MAWELVESFDKVPTFSIFRPAKYFGISKQQLGEAILEAFKELDPGFPNRSTDPLTQFFFNLPSGAVYFWDGNLNGYNLNDTSVQPQDLIDTLNNNYPTYDCTIVVDGDWGTYNYFLVIQNS